MFKTLTAIFLGQAAQAEQTLETANAALIMEQKIRDAEASQTTAKRALASLIARTRTEQKSLTALTAKIADLEGRTRDALAAGKESLALDAAKLLAELENERLTRTRTKERSEEKTDRLRLAVEKTQRRIVDLRQGLITAKAIENERMAMKKMRGDLTANAAITEGEAVLKRLLENNDPIAQMDALEEVEAGLSGNRVIDELAEAGFGDATKVRPEDVLNRLRPSENTQSYPSKAEQDTALSISGFGVTPPRT